MSNRLDDARELLQDAQTLFAQYAEHHARKDPPDLGKASVNGDMAIRIEEYLARTDPPPKEEV